MESCISRIYSVNSECPSLVFNVFVKIVWREFQSIVELFA